MATVPDNAVFDSLPLKYQDQINWAKKEIQDTASDSPAQVAETAKQKFFQVFDDMQTKGSFGIRAANLQKIGADEVKILTKGQLQSLQNKNKAPLLNQNTIDQIVKAVHEHFLFLTELKQVQQTKPKDKSVEPQRLWDLCTTLRKNYIQGEEELIAEKNKVFENITLLDDQYVKSFKEKQERLKNTWTTLNDLLDRLKEYPKTDKEIQHFKSQMSTEPDKGVDDRKILHDNTLEFIQSNIHHIENIKEVVTLLDQKKTRTPEKGVRKEDILKPMLLHTDPTQPKKLFISTLAEKRYWLPSQIRSNFNESPPIDALNWDVIMEDMHNQYMSPVEGDMGAVVTMENPLLALVDITNPLHKDVSPLPPQKPPLSPQGAKQTTVPQDASAVTKKKMLEELERREATFTKGIEELKKMKNDVFKDISTLKKFTALQNTLIEQWKMVVSQQKKLYPQDFPKDFLGNKSQTPEAYFHNKEHFKLLFDDSLNYIQKNLQRGMTDKEAKSKLQKELKKGIIAPRILRTKKENPNQLLVSHLGGFTNQLYDELITTPEAWNKIQPDIDKSTEVAKPENAEVQTILNGYPLMMSQFGLIGEAQSVESILKELPTMRHSNQPDDRPYYLAVFEFLSELQKAGSKFSGEIAETASYFLIPMPPFTVEANNEFLKKYLSAIGADLPSQALLDAQKTFSSLVKAYSKLTESTKKAFALCLPNPGPLINFNELRRSIKEFHDLTNDDFQSLSKLTLNVARFLQVLGDRSLREHWPMGWFKEIE